MNGGAVPVLRVPDQEDHETTVVPVLIMSGHVSEKSKIGPLIALTMITAQHGMTVSDVRRRGRYDTRLR
jgi:hypothetical protein